MDKQELKEVLQRQIEFENKIVEKAKSNSEKMENLALKELIRGIAFDSLKHANMLAGIIAILEAKKTPLISERISEELVEAIKEHISMEEKAIEIYNQILDSVKDERIKTIIRYIIEDEKRHHVLLKKIEKILIEGYTLSEEDLFELVYYYSLSHGTPGG